MCFVAQIPRENHFPLSSWSYFAHPSHGLKLQCLVARQLLTKVMHVIKHCWYVITCSRLEVNPTSYSLTVQIGASPLYVASQEGHSDVVDILLKAGADVHQATTEV